MQRHVWIPLALLIVFLAVAEVSSVQAQEQEGVDLQTLLQRIDDELVAAQKQELGRPFYRISKVDVTLQVERKRNREGAIKVLIPFFGTTTSRSVKHLINLTFDVNVELKSGNPPQDLAGLALADAITRFRRELQAAMLGIKVLDPPKVEFQILFSIEQNKLAKGGFSFNIIEVGGEIAKASARTQILKIEMQPK